MGSLPLRGETHSVRGLADDGPVVCDWCPCGSGWSRLRNLGIVFHTSTVSYPHHLTTRHALNVIPFCSPSTSVYVLHSPRQSAPVDDVRELCSRNRLGERELFETIVRGLFIRERKLDKLELAKRCADERNPEWHVGPT